MTDETYNEFLCDIGMMHGANAMLNVAKTARKLQYGIVVVSKNEDFKFNDTDLKCTNYTLYQVPNNKEPLSKVYNDMLKLFRTEKEIDVAIFMHADVYVDTTQLFKHIEECIDKYDVMGLCGTSTMNVSQSPLNWWTGSNPTPNAKWGCVTHGELGNQKSFFSQDRAEIKDHEVACIDGLCIIFNRNALYSDLIFDTNFKYDFYDTDISFQCVFNKNFKLGVLVEESLQHFSVGKSILTTDFLMHELYFRKKWHLEIPANSKLMELSIQLRKMQQPENNKLSV